MNLKKMNKGLDFLREKYISPKRGVACDQTVDTHTPHASIRCYGAKGAIEYTDVDTELFGLTYDEI